MPLIQRLPLGAVLVATVVICVCGCGSRKPDLPPVPPKTPVRLRADLPPRARDLVLKQLAEGLPDIRIELVTSDTVASSSPEAQGTQPTVVICDIPEVERLRDAGRIPRLDEFIAVKEIALFATNAIPWQRTRNQFWAVPLDAAPMALLANARALRNAGLDPLKKPRTWGEFCSAIGNCGTRWDETGKRYIGFGLPNAEPGMSLQFFSITAWADRVAIPVKQSVPSLTSTQMQKTLRWFDWLYSDGLAQEGQTWEEVIRLFREDRCAVIVATPELFHDLRQLPDLKDDIVVWRIHGPGGRSSATVNLGRCLVLESGAGDATAAVRVLRFLSLDSDAAMQRYRELGWLPALKDPLDRPEFLKGPAKVFVNDVLRCRFAFGAGLPAPQTDILIREALHRIAAGEHIFTVCADLDTKALQMGDLRRQAP